MSGPDATPPRDPRAARRTVAIAVILAVVSLCVFVPRGIVGLSWADDEGDEILAAVRVLQGKALYVDILESLKLPIYGLALLFKLLGVSLLLPRLLEALVCAALVAVIFLYAARHAGLLFGTAAAICAIPWTYPMWAILGWDWEGVILILLTGMAFARHLDTGRPAWLLVAGGLAGLNFIFQPDASLLSVAALGALIVARNPYEGRRGGESAADARRALLRLAAMYGAVIAVIAAVTGYAGILRPMVMNMIVLPLTDYGFAAHLHIPYPLPPFGQSPEHWWYGTNHDIWQIYLLPLAVLPAAAVVCAHRLVTRRPGAWGGLVLCVACLIVFLQTFPRADIMHFVLGLVGVLILMVYVLAAVRDALAPRIASAAGRAVLAGALLLPVGGVTADGAVKVAQTWPIDPVPSAYPFLRGVKIERAREREFRSLHRYLHHAGQRPGAGAPVLILPDDPILYLILGYDPPVRQAQLTPGLFDARIEREIVEAIDRRGVEFVIYRGWDSRHAIFAAAPSLGARLEKGFAPVHGTGSYTVLRRTEAPR